MPGDWALFVQDEDDSWSFRGTTPHEEAVTEFEEFHTMQGRTVSIVLLTDHMTEPSEEDRCPR